MNTDFENDPTIIKIRKMLKKAEAAAKLGTPEGDNEASLANEMAARWITKHSIDQALLVESGEIQDAIVNKRIPVTEGYAMDKRVLLNAIVMALGCQVVFIRMRRANTRQSYTYTAHIFAYESDMKRIEFLYELLLPQMLLGAAAAPVPRWETARSYRKSWMNGFTVAIRQRLERTREEAMVEADNALTSAEREAIEAKRPKTYGKGSSKRSTSTELVLATRDESVHQAYKAAHPKTVTSGRSLGGSGHSAGRKAGERASLGENNIGGKRGSIAA